MWFTVLHRTVPTPTGVDISPRMAIGWFGEQYRQYTTTTTTASSDTAVNRTSASLQCNAATAIVSAVRVHRAGIHPIPSASSANVQLISSIDRLSPTQQTGPPLLQLVAKLDADIARGHMRAQGQLKLIPVPLHRTKKKNMSVQTRQIYHPHTAARWSAWRPDLQETIICEKKVVRCKHELHDFCLKCQLSSLPPYRTKGR